MKKLLTITTTTLALMAIEPAQAEFGDANVEKGCAILAVNVSSRIDNMSWTTPASCARLKGSFTKAKESDNLMDCTIAMIMTRNEMRGLSHFDKPSLEVRQNIVKGCAMVVFGWEEWRADRMKSVVKE
jgi:hypothetical protein